MSGASSAAETAFRVADRLRADGPWEVYGERTRRFELHLAGRTVEMVRGPIALEGYGIRLLRSRGESTGTGYQSSTDLSDAGVRATAAEAETLSKFSEFPARQVELPGAAKGHPSVEVVDRTLWDDPLRAVESYVARLLEGFDGRAGIVPSFGSLRATLIETTIANSAGLRVAFPQTLVELEVAVKAFGGPEGPAPGEYWVNETTRQLDTGALAHQIDDWCRFAQDVRRASPPPTGDLPVLLPASVLAGILPPVLGFRFTGPARLRKLAPEAGEKIAAEALSIADDGLVPWAPASAPFDAEGTPRVPGPMISHGAVAGLLYDALHSAAFEVPSTASATRSYGPGGFADWRRFVRAPHVSTSTVSVQPGTGGSDAELAEQAGDGIWVQQFGWAIPDEISGAFGGEIRIGYRVRHGKLAEPVRGGTVGGVVLAPPGRPSLLANVVGIGSKAELSEALSSPTLLVRPLVVAGAAAPEARGRA